MAGLDMQVTWRFDGSSTRPGAEYIVHNVVGAASKPKAVTPPATKSGEARSILVVDDMADNRTVISLMLSMDGHKVEAVADAASAIEAIKQHRYDLVLMDVMMPECDGIAATGLIRSMDGEMGAVPIIAITASVSPKTEASCRSAGMQDYIAKPVTFDQLRRMVNKWLAQAAPAAGFGPQAAFQG